MNALSKFEAVDGALDALLRMGDFATCEDGRAWIKADNRLLDACLAAGMPFDTAVHSAWAAEFVAGELLSAAPSRPCWSCDAPTTGTGAHFGHYVPRCSDCSAVPANLRVRVAA